jgi:AcrR family transcriptional regulator
MKRKAFFAPFAPAVKSLRECEMTINKREMILKTTARLFSTQGFDATTTLQLACEAGVTEPLIYYYFSGKDELFTRLIENIA